MTRVRSLCVLLVSCTGLAHAALPLVGVNLAGAEFGSSGTTSYGLPNPVLPGVDGVNYIFPNQGEVDYYLGKGMNTFRLPFLWERLQPDLTTGVFDSAQLQSITSFVNQTTAKGGTVILDPHDFGQYVSGGVGYPIGSPQVSVQKFADFWGTLGGAFKDNDRVVFGLMNEPAGTPLLTTENWFTAAQAAITAIRGAGASNLILAPGNYYTGAWSWTTGNGHGTPNAQVMGGLVDLGVNGSGRNLVYEVHQYLDENYSGQSPSIDHDPVRVLADFTAWLAATGNRGFLGEFAVAPGTVQQAAVTALLGNLEANASLWAGWTWWAGGPWWDTNGTNYMFNLDPVGGVDAPQMAYLQPFLPIPEPAPWMLLAAAAVGFLALTRSRRRIL